MIPEFIKKHRKKTFSDCRELFIKINGAIQDESQGSGSKSETLVQTLVQTPEDSNQAYSTCDCCQRNDVPNENMTRIEAGQQMCTACLAAFYEASRNKSNPIF